METTRPRSRRLYPAELKARAVGMVEEDVRTRCADRLRPPILKAFQAFPERALDPREPRP